jgi:hypothetical protein
MVTSRAVASTGPVAASEAYRPIYPRRLACARRRCASATNLWTGSMYTKTVTT